MNVNKEGRDLIVEFEGFRNNAYDDGFGNLTIGIGHCGRDVYKGMYLTDEEVYDLFEKDIARFEDNVNRYVEHYDLNQNEFNALVSFAFNIGNVDELLRCGDLAKKDICDRMLLYCHANGEVVEGLKRRREAEVALFKKGEVKKDISYYFDLIANTLIGKYGNGVEREKKLGTDYEIVQESINTLYEYLKKNI